MKRRVFSLLIVMLASMSSIAFAETVSVGLKASTLGAGLEFGTACIETFAASRAFQNDLSREEEGLQNDSDAYEYYPVVSIGVGYRF